ncbi:hypothetical protein GCM10027217_32510 [Pseudomaricurvus hydrocarbonicus]
MSIVVPLSPVYLKLSQAIGGREDSRSAFCLKRLSAVLMPEGRHCQVRQQSRFTLTHEMRRRFRLQ